VTDDRCDAVHGPTGERCLRGPHIGRHVGRGPVEWVGSGEALAARGKKTREQGTGPAYLEFRYGPNYTPLGYFWGPGREKEGLSGKPARFGIIE
jgi:hypothetical protein